MNRIFLTAPFIPTDASTKSRSDGSCNYGKQTKTKTLQKAKYKFSNFKREKAEKIYTISMIERKLH
jgi:hypothetical protein